MEALDRMGYGGIILDTVGQLLSINKTADQLLLERANDGAHRSSAEGLKQLLRSRMGERLRINEDAWIALRRDDGRPLIIHAVQIENGAAGGPSAVLILVDLEKTSHPSSEALQKLFQLTPAEAKLAVEISAGKSLNEIAAATSVKLGTVRKQLASIFTKTNTTRQGELIALLARVAILP